MSKVTIDATGKFIKIVHGNTIHGLQSITKTGNLPGVSSSYHRTSLARHMLSWFAAARPGATVAVLGLGARSLAASATPEQSWTFYEIDPAVIRIAQNPSYFSFLSDASSKIDAVLKDARMTLSEIPDASLDLLIVDSFTLDAIRMHLITLEGVQLSQRKLCPDEAILWHISNRFLDLRKVLAAAARDVNWASLCGLTITIRNMILRFQGRSLQCGGS